MVNLAINILLVSSEEVISIFSRKLFEAVNVNKKGGKKFPPFLRFLFFMRDYLNLFDDLSAVEPIKHPPPSSSPDVLADV